MGEIFIFVEARLLSFDRRVFSRNSTIVVNLERVLLLHGDAAPPSGIRLGGAHVAGEVARDDGYLNGLVLDGGDVLHGGAGRRFLGLGGGRALREARLPDVRRLGWHSRAWTRLPDPAARPRLRREVNAYVHEHHDARGDVEAAERRVEHVAYVL